MTAISTEAAASRIIINAHRVNQGLMPDLSTPAGDSDFYFVPAEDPEIAVQRILELVKTRIPKRFGLDPIRDIQVLCPMNRGGVGARSLRRRGAAREGHLDHAQGAGMTPAASEEVARKFLGRVRTHTTRLIMPIVAIYERPGGSDRATFQSGTAFLINLRGRPVLVTARRTLYGHQFNEDPFTKHIVFNGRLRGLFRTI